MDKLDVFQGIDHCATIRIDGATLTVSFTFASVAIAHEVGERLRAAHASGEVVTFELANPASLQ